MMNRFEQNWEVGLLVTAEASQGIGYTLPVRAESGTEQQECETPERAGE